MGDVAEVLRTTVEFTGVGEQRGRQRHQKSRRQRHLKDRRQRHLKDRRQRHGKGRRQRHGKGRRQRHGKGRKWVRTSESEGEEKGIIWLSSNLFEKELFGKESSVYNFKTLAPQTHAGTPK